MKIMLLGGAGFIGLNLANVLVQRGHDVHIADCSAWPVCCNYPIPAVAGHHLLQSADNARLESIIDELGIECVISLASSLIPSSSFSDFDNELNQVIAPTFRLLEHLAKRSISFVYMSSGGTVYGTSDKPAIAENDPLCPINYYGFSKLLFEQYLAFVGRTQQLRHLILRPSNPFGPFQSPHRMQGLVAVAVNKVLHGQPIEIWGDGSVVRDYLWVEDLAEAVAALLLKDEAWGRTFNVGSGQGHSIRDLLAMIGSLTGKPVEVHYREARAVDVPNLVLDVSRLQETIDFRPRNLRDALVLYLGGLQLR
jgi:UDP-glucose 4-epimerase